MRRAAGAKRVMDRSISDMVDASLRRIREMTDVSMIIGEKITADDGTTIIPVSKVSVAFASGGSDFGKKNESGQANFGGGVGSAMKITPVAFLAISNGSVRVLPVTQSDAGPVDRAVDLIPQIIDKVASIFNKKKEETGAAEQE